MKRSFLIIKTTCFFFLGCLINNYAFGQNLDKYELTGRIENPDHLRLPTT